MDIFSKETWKNYDAAGLIKQRLELIKRVIPDDVSTILDAGCGNGAITNELGNFYAIVGLDLSPAALEHVQTPKILGSVSSLPFSDKSFDLCMCNEVLEHLHQAELAEAISELKRVATRYVLLSVPNQEQLDQGLVKCPVCGSVFHVYGHLQSFDIKRLDSLMGMQAKWHKTLGPKTRRVWPQLLHYRQQQLNQWFNPQFTLDCPDCGNREFKAKSSLATKLANAIARLNIPRKRYWLIALYELEQPASE